MDNFKVIYLILRILERALDGQVDTDALEPERAALLVECMD